MIGNDDCGQMSAWYILSTLGFYPVNPATGNFVLGSPNVKKAIIHIDGFKRFVIKAQNLSEQNIYNENPKFNGSELSNHRIHYKEIMKGGILKFNMTSQ
jgi:putative alpha-1,2-mannosidase